jgi:hypothetical protein
MAVTVANARDLEFFQACGSQQQFKRDKKKLKGGKNNNWLRGLSVPPKRTMALHVRYIFNACQFGRSAKPELGVALPLSSANLSLERGGVLKRGGVQPRTV